jgi:hypothetical protein
MALTRHSLRKLVAVLVLGGAMIGFMGTARAQNMEGNRPSIGPGGLVTSGKLQFRQYCAQCHGMDATGDGPVSGALKKKPANLTMHSKNNGGVFPEQEVRDFIDGSKTAASHGTREMPIWGYAFMFRQGAQTGSGAPPLTEDQVNRKIQILVNYIKSIQVQ